MEIRFRTLSGLIWSTFSAIGGTSIQLVQLVVLGRLLTAQDFGLVAMAMVVQGFANVYADVGLSNAILTHQALTVRQLSSMYWLNWAASITFALVMMLSAPLAAQGFGVTQLEPLIVWSAFSLLVAPLGLQFQLLLQKELRIKHIALIELLSGSAGLAIAVFSAFKGHGAYSIVFGNLAMASIKSVSFFFIGIKKWPLSLRFSSTDIKPFFSFGAFQVGERTMNFAAWNMDKMLIGGLLGAHSLGLYNVAYQLMQKPIQFMQPILSRVMTPLFSTMSQDSARLRRSYLLVVQGMAMLLFPVLFAMVIFAEPVITCLVGPNWHAAAPVLRWLSVLGCFYAIGVPIGSLLLAKMRVDIAFWLNVWALFLYANAVILGSRFGIEGVAVTLLIVQFTGMFSIGFWIRWKLIGMRPIEYLSAFIPSLLWSVSAGLFAWAVGYLMHRVDWVELGTVKNLLLSVSLMGGAYVLLVLWFQQNLLPNLANILRQYSGGQQ